MPRWNFTAGKYGSDTEGGWRVFNFESKWNSTGRIYTRNTERGGGKRLRSKSVTRHRISARVATGKYYAAGWGEGRDKDGKSRRGRQSSEKLGCTNILYPWPCIHLCTENASLSPSLSLVSRGFVPLFFFFTSTVLDFLPFCATLRKSYFSVLGVHGFFLSGEEDGLWRVSFFRLLLPLLLRKEGFVYLLKGNGVPCRMVSRFTRSSWWKFRCLFDIFSLLLFASRPNETSKKFIDFYFPPFLFHLDHSYYGDEMYERTNIFWIKWNASNRILRVNRISSLRYNSSSDNFFEKHPIL